MTLTVSSADRAGPAGDVLTARGRVIRVRPTQPDDAAALLALHQRDVTATR